jgi:hypothetical protein
MRERRWLVIGADGRHVTLGRASDPSPEELAEVAAALEQQDVAGWLVVSEGRYYDPGELGLLMVHPLAERPGATWEQARDAFIAARAKKLSQ